MSFHTFVEKVFNKSSEECKYAKKMIGQFRKRVTATPRTQGLDFCVFVLHCRVDVFLNVGYVYEREKPSGMYVGSKTSADRLGDGPLLQEKSVDL